MDLISREALIDFIDPGHLRHPGELCFSEIDVVNMLNHAPTIDAVPVVRCKDCKHYHKDVGWCDKHSHFINSDGSACHPWESNDWKMFMDDDFCSDGERKEGAE